ncbi:hypothetical protein CHH28_00935 [Bacterioplanes sanyensis]|uniref:Uncharacterized protein n=1 Tax=Bacterioplanes sanyensis TaxID=1249553 RepID=A0A222FGI1_9GAMM|nr:hypothetical protein [Bacterioplanes sanyensis]ASP37333.1 hypothetical protein CHH28_00935 [Bacterioplanes sanyensis]
MLEQRRLDYLAAMGITQWMPREPLANAAPSHWLPEASLAPSHADVEAVAEQHHIPPVVASELLELEQRSNNAAAATQAAPSSAPATEADSDAQAANTSGEVDLTPPRFELWFAPCSARGIWVADNQQDLNLMRRFIARVMTAMGGEPELSREPVAFRWPFIESRQHDQSLPVALQALTAQWQFIQQQGADYVISVGADSQHWLQRVNVPLHHHIDDLHSCLQSAAQKRALWQALRTLQAL